MSNPNLKLGAWCPLDGSAGARPFGLPPHHLVTHACVTGIGLPASRYVFSRTTETQVEEALIRHLETFLLELGGDFTFVGRQRRLRVGDAWHRVDLLFFHRRLRWPVKDGTPTPPERAVRRWRGPA